MTWWSWLVGEQGHLVWWQMVVRTVIVFTYGLLAIRFAGQRVFGKASALDLIVAIVAGSSLSRTLTGNAPLLATLIATSVLILVHRMLGHAATRWPTVEWLVKGRAQPIVRDGRIDADHMRRLGISQCDLAEAVRLAGHDDEAPVRAAHVEPNGRISIQAYGPVAGEGRGKVEP